MNDKRTDILKATIRLFAEDGIGVATSKIAKEANVSNGTLFNYFTTKQELIDAVYLFIKEHMANEIKNNADAGTDLYDMFFSLWQDYILWAHQNPLEHQVLDLLRFSQKLSTEVLQTGGNFFANACNALTKAIANKELVDLPIDFYAEFTSAGLMAVVHYARERQLKKDELNILIHNSFQMYWSGISCK